MSTNPAGETVATLSDHNVDVRFNTRTNQLEIQDKRIGTRWTQEPFCRDFTVGAVSHSRHTLGVDLSGPFALHLTMHLTESSELVFTCRAAPDRPMDRLVLPAFRVPNRDHYLLQTDSQGLLLPVDDTSYPLDEMPIYYCGGGPGMAWVGVTDGRLQSGYMAIFETPYDTAVSFRRVEGLITFAPVLLPCMGTFGYERRIRYVFFAEGGYVAQCKRYRAYAWRRYGVQTLKERSTRFPAIDKMTGAVHVYVWDRARQLDFAREMKSAGIEKALVLWDPNHRPYPPAGYDNALKELGYCSAGYDLYSDIHPDDYPGNAAVEVVPLKRNVYPGLFERITARTADGAHYSNEFGTYICPEAVRNEIPKRVDREMALYPHEAVFVDVYQANGLYECYNPDHPVSREGYANAIIKNLALLEDRYGVFIGGEFGADFAASKGAFVHGMMTLQRTWFNSDADREGTIWFKGDWQNNPNPSIMVGTSTATPAYHAYSIDEYTRVPLYELVYHDAVVTSWRWEDSNHHCPEIWWKKDLFNVLYGSAPLWSVDRRRWDSFRNTFIESYQTVCPWLNKIRYDEMVTHRFLTEDRQVQETVFSSGRRVIVNFGGRTREAAGHTVGAGSYVTIQEDAGAESPGQ